MSIKYRVKERLMTLLSKTEELRSITRDNNISISINLDNFEQQLMMAVIRLEGELRERSN